MKFLLIEDNLNIAEGLVYAFKNNGYDLNVTSNLKDAVICLEKGKINLVILDVMLPDGNGFDFYKSEVKNKKIPTIFLTAIDDEDEVVKGLNLGADDYMTKPFSTKELLARVNKIIIKNKNTSIIKVKDVKFDIDKMKVYKDTEEVSLTNLEIRILYLLFINIGKVVSRNTLLDKIWEATGNDVSDHTVTVYLKRIREKLGTDIITTVKGIGYRIDNDEE